MARYLSIRETLLKGGSTFDYFVIFCGPGECQVGLKEILSAIVIDAADLINHSFGDTQCIIFFETILYPLSEKR